MFVLHNCTTTKTNPVMSIDIHATIQILNHILHFTTISSITQSFLVHENTTVIWTIVSKLQLAVTATALVVKWRIMNLLYSKSDARSVPLCSM